MNSIKNIDNFSKLLELFLDKLFTEQNLAQSTLNSYKRDISDFLNFISKRNVKVSNIEFEDITNWVSFLKLNHLQGSTIVRKVTVIKQFFSFLFNEKYLVEDLSKNLIIPKKTSVLPKFLTENEVKNILDFLKRNNNSFKDMQMYVLTELLYATGLRVSELVTLKISNLDEKFKNILVKGKGNKERLIPIGEIAQLSLKNYVKNKNFEKFKSSFKGNYWLFPSRKKHLSRQTYFSKLKKVAVKVGLNPKLVSPHILRHAFASHMLKNGADLKVIQHLLGHEDIATVEIYTHVNLKDALNAIEKHPLRFSLQKD